MRQNRNAVYVRLALLKTMADNRSNEPSVVVIGTLSVSRIESRSVMKPYKLVVVLLALAAILFTVAHAQQKSRTKVRRAAPPEFSKDDTKLIFYDDVFAEGLDGERPANLGQASSGTVVAGPSGSGSTNTGSGEDSAGGDAYAWKNVIDAVAIEDEVKKIKLSIDQTVTTPTQFAGGGYKQARRDFSMLAMLFTIIAEYDGDVRFKSDAPKLRDYFARAAGGSKVGSQQAYAQADRAKEDLTIVVNGGKVNVPGSSEEAADWSSIVDRSPLMQRLETAQQSKLQQAVASEAEFKANEDTLFHEANIVAAIGEVLTREGMEDAIEEDYAAHAIRMRDAAREVIDALKLKNYDQARKAVGEIGQACTKCHEDWR